MKKFKDPDYLIRCGNRLRISIDALKISDKDFAAACGLSPSQVSNHTTGGQRIGLDAAIAIEDAYKIPMGWVFRASLSQLDEKTLKLALSRPRESWAR